MPELPEITVIASQMNKEIPGKRVVRVEARQPKQLNMSVAEFAEIVKGKVVGEVSSKGKWIFINLEPASYMLINLGMGGDLVYFRPGQELPEKYHFRLEFADSTGFTIRFYWLGTIHLVREENLSEHKLTSKLGLQPTDERFTFRHFSKLLGKRKARIKSFLLTQKNVAGIGNVYIQDILFLAKLHPNRKVSSLTEKEKTGLYNAIQAVLHRSIEMRGLEYEKDFYGEKGGYTMKEFKVGYRAGKPCPVCGAKIEKLRTGNTSSYICPECQSLGEA